MTPGLPLAEHSDDVRTVAFSPDGKWLASGSEDTTVKLWRLNPLAGGKPSAAQLPPF